MDATSTVNLAQYELWFRLLHLFGVVGFALVHGTTMAVLLRLRSHRARLDPVDVRSLLRLSSAVFAWVYRALAVVVIGGVLAGVAGGWFTSGQLWVWLGIAIFASILAVMHFVARPLFAELRRVVRTSGEPSAGAPSGVATAVGENLPAELERILSTPKPVFVASFGLIGIAAVMTLMVIKPF